MTCSLRVPSIWVASILVLACLGYVLLHREVAQQWSVQVVLSDSMRPSLRAGDLVILHRLPPDRYQVGDVVSARVPKLEGQLVLHRITSLQQDRQGLTLISTQGDANTNGDPWVITAGNITGKQVARLAWLGYPAIWARTPPGFSILALVVLGLLMGVMGPVGDG